MLRLNKLLGGLTRHLQAKLVLLLLAGACWFFVHTSQEMEIEFTFPLDLKLDLPEGRALVETPPAAIQVLLRGKGRNLLLFALFGEGRCVVEAGRGGDGIPLSSKQLELDGALDLSVVSLFPAQLNLDVDRLETRRLPVRLAGVLEAAEGHVLTGDPRLEPERIKVTGPRGVLDTLDAILTVPVDFSNRKRDVDEELELAVPAPSLTLEVETARLVVGVQRRAERRFASVPVRARDLESPLSFRPRTVDLTIVGGELELATLEKRRIQVVLDGSRLRPGQTQLAPTVILPPGFHWTEPDPPLFRILGRRPVRTQEAHPTRDSLGQPAGAP